MPAKNQSKNRLLLGITVIGISSLFFIKPIAQNPNYHLFADQRTILSLEHFWNVISNMPFLIIGLLGMFFILKNYNSVKLNANHLVFYFGIILTGIGSMYYHHDPSSETLVWDRLPMTISFMAFFSIIIGDCICRTTGKRILLPLILLGMMSIIYWQMTKHRGQEDLRFYALIQFLPMILIPIILLLYKSATPFIKTYWLISLAYLIAKVVEASDEFIFTNFHFISGHSLKHLIASIVPLLLLNRISIEKNTKNKRYSICE